MNLIIFAGRVGGDAQVRHLDSGMKVISFSVAHSERFTQNGEKKEKTTWAKCTMWRNNDQSYGVAEYIKKGSYVTVTGIASVSAFPGKDGSPAASLEIRVQSVELGPKGEGSATPSTGTQQQPSQGFYTPPSDSGGNGDDLPF